ncbi:carboxymuconolactone decarboxylase family protein [uncultured Tolumonas sp.]|uniref:carboxymuconolactone decarboxylase family protein n=1 Tax=uncultured Tolumonas sp. TaxID=263765 RepID=UPI002931A5DD|nr:carboxymuconolactone decarboxylase family protein [uncultured Tolumonas sp.]
MANLSISNKQQSIATIAALAAQGDLDNLEKSLHTGLDAKLTINEIKEILIQLYAYVGFPRSINAINTFIRVLASRQSSGIIDETGKEPSPRPEQKSKFELGCEMQMALLGALETGPALSFIPTIDTFIKEHLFADIWSRDNLDFQSREIVTIAALTSLKGLNMQLNRHLQIALNIGFQPRQLTDLITLLASLLEKNEADNASEVLSRILNK